jgi:hypothetical protein
MNRLTLIALFPAIVALNGCAEPHEPASLVAPTTAGAQTDAGSARQAAPPPGSGLVLDSVTGITLPLIGRLGDVVVDQAVITNFELVENVVGQVVGLEATGVLQLTGGVLGTNVVTEDFNTLVSVTSSGPGQCDLVTIDLGPIAIDALGVASVDVPVATLNGRGSGAVGSLLCNLGRLLSGVVGGVTAGVQGVVNAINNLI